MLKRMVEVFLLGVTIMALIVTGLACSGEEAEEAQKTEGSEEAEETVIDTYIIGDEEGDWGYPSPFAAYPRGPGLLRMFYVFDTLVWKDDSGFTDALAEDWEFDEAENSYTFTLREGVEWHDGTPFSINDVLFTFEYLKEHPLSWFGLENIEEVAELDDGRVQVYLKEPHAAFLNNVAGVMPILPEHIWSEVEEPTEFLEPEAVVGTGPYQLEDYQREQGRYRYHAYEDYYLGDPLVENLLMVKVSEPHLALQRGDVNYAMVEAESVDTLEEANFKVDEGLHDWNLKLMFNHREEPFEQIEFRRAIAHAIDVEEIVERALRGHGLPGSPGMISPDSRWYAGDAELPDYEHDPEKALDKLNEIDYDFEREINLLTMARFSREAEIAAGQLEEIGLNVETRALESSVLDSRIREWNYDLAISGHGAVGGDPEMVERFMVGEGSPHLNSRYQHSELEEVIQQQSRETDEEQRKELVSELQQIYAREIPAYTLHHPTWYYAYDDQVDWFFTHDGIATGIPMPLNERALVRGQG